MGYYTHHTLTILEGDTETDHATNIGELSEYGDSLWEEPQKWYDMDDNMIEYSKRYPDTVFELFLEGEESGDIGYTYYQNGKSQECPGIITYAPFDKSKLK